MNIYLIKSYIKKTLKFFLPVCYKIRHYFGMILFAPKNQKIFDSCRDSIQKYKSIYNRQRCFIIGNGPSLSAKDLDKLKNEICFGTNRIFDIFDKTAWRPTYYCISDCHLIKNILKKIPYIKCVRFITNEIDKKCYYVNDSLYIRNFAEIFYPNMPKFSSDISNGIHDGYTVTYICIQIAVYMGFKEIILLGCDHNYSVTMRPDGSIEKHEGVIDHFSATDRVLSTPNTYWSTLAYQAAKKYTDEHGIKIYNATRGGKLEVFERVDFDSLFPEDDKK